MFLRCMVAWPVITAVIEVESVNDLCNTELRSLFDGLTVHLRFTEVATVDRIVCIPRVIKFIGVDEDKARPNCGGERLDGVAFFGSKARRNGCQGNGALPEYLYGL